MTFLRWWSAAIALLGASIALCLGVVCIQFVVYMDTEPRLHNDWPKLVTATTLFAILAFVGAAAFWTLHRRSRWRWPAQGLLLVTAVVFVQLFWRLLST